MSHPWTMAQGGAVLGREIVGARADVMRGQRLSEVVIAWVNAGSDSHPEMILQQNGAMPQALHQIVPLNRYRMRGDVNGVFAGKTAFRLLHDRFAVSAAARATPYWCKCTIPYCDP